MDGWQEDAFSDDDDDALRSESSDNQSIGAASPPLPPLKLGLPFILNTTCSGALSPPLPRTSSASAADLAAHRAAVVSPATADARPTTTTSTTTATAALAPSRSAASASHVDKKRGRMCKTDGCENYIVHKGLCCRHGVRTALLACRGDLEHSLDHSRSLTRTHALDRGSYRVARSARSKAATRAPNTAACAGNTVRRSPGGHARCAARRADT